MKRADERAAEHLTLHERVSGMGARVLNGEDVASHPEDCHSEAILLDQRATVSRQLAQRKAKPESAADMAHNSRLPAPCPSS